MTHLSIWHMTHLTRDQWALLSHLLVSASAGVRWMMVDKNKSIEEMSSCHRTLTRTRAENSFVSQEGKVNVNNHCHYDPSAHAYSNYHQCWLKTKQPSPLISPDTGWVPPCWAGEASLASSHQYSIKKDHYCFIRHSQKIFVIPHKNWW